MKKILSIGVIVVVVISAVLVYRAETIFRDQQVEPASGITQVGVDATNALQHFSDALKIPTISHDDRSNFDTAAFLEFHEFLQAATRWYIGTPNAP